MSKLDKTRKYLHILIEDITFHWKTVSIFFKKKQFSHKIDERSFNIDFLEQVIKHRIINTVEDMEKYFIKRKNNASLPTWFRSFS